VINLP